jgi:RNA polymerase sigma-32 factor
VGLLQAVRRFEPDKGFRLATYAVWWIKAAIQEYILRSWSPVKLGTTTNQKKLFFNLRKAKSKVSVREDGDLRPTKLIAKRLGMSEQDVIDMNRRLGGDLSLNSPIREDGYSREWQDWLVDAAPGAGRERGVRQPAQGARSGPHGPQAHVRGASSRRKADDP